MNLNCEGCFIIGARSIDIVSDVVAAFGPHILTHWECPEFHQYISFIWYIWDRGHRTLCCYFGSLVVGVVRRAEMACLLNQHLCLDIKFQRVVPIE